MCVSVCVCGTLMGGLHMELAFGEYAFFAAKMDRGFSQKNAGSVEAQHGEHEPQSTSTLPLPLPSTR